MPTVLARLARLSVLLLVASAVAACSSGSGTGAPVGGLYRSGTRLRARVTDAGGGARRFDGWYDTQLEMPCSFQLATDGVRRCLPDLIVAPSYLDGACSVLVTDYVDPNAPARFLVTPGSWVPAQPAGCGAELVAAGAQDEYSFDTWRLGPEQPSASALFYRDGSGACTQGVASRGPVHPLEPISPAQLVGATLTTEARGPSMAVEILTGDDGSKTIGQTFDATLGRPCFPSWGYAAIDDYRCYASTAHLGGVPMPQGCSSYTATAACGDEIFMSDARACAPSFLSLAATPCGASSVAGVQTYEIGAPFDPGRFPSLTSDRVGTGRVRLVITRPTDDARALVVNTAGFVVQDRYTPGPFFDTERQLPCDAATFEDGTIRCLTTDALQDNTYSDPACTNPIAAQPIPSQVCPTWPLMPTPQLAFRRPGRLYTLGPLVARTAAYTQNPYAVPPTCDPVSSPAMYFDLVPADPGMLATLTSLTE